MTASHRLGSRTTLLASRRIKRAPVVELLEAAANDVQRADVAASARIVVIQDRTQSELSVADAAMIDVDSLGPVRRPPSHTRMGNYIGRFPVPSRGGSRSVWFESLNELHHLRDLSLDRTIVAAATQPMLVLWPLRSGQRAHFPDFSIERSTGSITIYEVTRRAKLNRPETLAQYALMAETARCLGWSFEIRTELPAQVVRNQALVRAYRHSGPSRDATWPGIRDGSSWPQQLRATADLLCGHGFGDGAVLHLLAVGRLTTELTRPLSADTLLWPSENAPEGAKPWIHTM